MYGTRAKEREQDESSKRAGQRNKEAVQRGAREPDNETKRAGQRNKERRTTKQREPNRRARELNTH